jgi:hypothetical protein
MTWSGVGGDSSSDIILKTWPNCVRSPVATTRPVARPEHTIVPMKAMFCMSAVLRAAAGSPVVPAPRVSDPYPDPDPGGQK